ncbi:MAG: NAD-dependent epimerase/dehydratase family protein [Ruminococcaceae bacterium]|nr:NAD-dependent epimerase/dehydratase family protein [Oscillospiraceae bacterium]
MNMYLSAAYRDDLTRALSVLDLQALQSKRILITGASGLIGSALVDLLLQANLMQEANITVYAAGRSREKLEDRFSHGLGHGLVPVVYDATQPLAFDFATDYVIHGASNASPDKYVSEPVDTMLANILGMRELLEYARRCGAQKTVYISSSEVYGVLGHGKPFREDEYGTVNILGDRASYPMGKRAAETLCVSYANQYGMDVSIVRPGHIYGPTAQRSDKRISSAFAFDAAEGRELVMKSAGTQLRSYCHCLDCATATLTVLLQGASKQAYNISNPDSIITIRQMAEIIARSAGVVLRVDAPTAAEKAAFNPMDNSSLDSEKLLALGWRGIFDHETGLAHTVQVLKELL